MIVQSAAEGEAHFVIRQADHARMAGEFACAFGNSAFEPLHPKPLMEFVVAHHDEGWAETDAAPERDPQTGLPYQFLHTPRSIVNRVHVLSPDFNERQHPFCGLLASMHTWGLYYGRYGLSERATIESIPPEHKSATLAMLRGERERQARLQARLAADPATAPLADDKFLFYCYKRLQFFDTLALYFNMTRVEDRRKTAFRHVPRTPADDVTITLVPVARGTYRVTPYPFASPRLEVVCRGRFLRPLPPDADLAQVFRQTPVQEERVVVIGN